MSPGYWPTSRIHCYANCMETRSLIMLLGLLAAAGALAEAYTWTDESGVVHYSDKPNPGAKTIELDGASPARPRAARQAAANRQDDAEQEPQTFSYQSIEIASPSAEETLWNIGGALDVSLTLSPSLRAGDQVRVYFDGTPQMTRGVKFELQEVHRGVHNLQVEVIDGTGKLMIRSRPSRFYVQQNSVL